MSSARTIVVATDFSPTATRALERARELAGKRGDRLVLVNAISLDPVPLAGPELLVFPTDYEGRVHDASKKALQKLVDEIKGEGVDATGALSVGSPAEIILQAAKEHDADMIVIGTRGNSGFKHLLLGSVAEAVVRRSTVPVLTVHPGDTQPLSAIERVLIPSDFSGDAEAAVDHIVDVLPEAHSTHITLVHVYQLPVMMAPLVGFAPDLPVLSADARDEAHRALDPMAARLRDQGYEVEVLGREGDPATVISELSETPGADLIVMGTRGLSKLEQVLLGSTAERVVQHAMCPVLTLRRRKD